MNGKYKISDKYRKKVDELLDNQSNLNLLNPLKLEELDEIWEEISTEMDISEVWNNISFDLDTVMPIGSDSGIILKSIAAVLIILLGITPVKKSILIPVHSQSEILIENEQDERSAEQIIKNNTGDSNIGEEMKSNKSPELGKSFDQSEDGNKATTSVREKTGMTPGTQITERNEVVSEVFSAFKIADSNLIVSSDTVPTENSSILPALLPDDLEKIKLFPKAGFESLKIENNSSTDGYSLPLTDRGRISAGLITSFKNTWLLNHETLDGLKSKTLNTTELVYYPEVGLGMNYSLNQTWSLQLDGFFSSNTGQKYFEYINGLYLRKEITLKYSTFDLSVKYKFTETERFIHRCTINLLTGLYISSLHYANQKINTDLENIGSQYEKYDFGVWLGGEFELQIFNQLYLAPGLFLSIGIPNIYKGDSNIPGYLRRTHNGSEGFQLTIYYHFD